MVTDRNGAPVTVGTRVRVLEIAPFLEGELPSAEWRDLKTMVGQVFEVYEVDEYGGAWVEKIWKENDGRERSHSYSLASHEMEIVQPDGSA